MSDFSPLLAFDIQEWLPVVIFIIIAIISVLGNILNKGGKKQQPGGRGPRPVRPAPQGQKPAAEHKGQGVRLHGRSAARALRPRATGVLDTFASPAPGAPHAQPFCGPCLDQSVGKHAVVEGVACESAADLAGEHAAEKLRKAFGGRGPGDGYLPAGERRSQFACAKPVKHRQGQGPGHILGPRARFAEEARSRNRLDLHLSPDEAE